MLESESPKNPYEDILNSSRPISAHKKMSRAGRAKQFMPFKSLGDVDFLDEEVSKEPSNSPD
ncbi:hypothetical protein IJ380_01030 [Candidatus Saccharibacteria bacterium]|nr:hypothetical protein [Candidatus Saccharibacteria bacterium]